MPLALTQPLAVDDARAPGVADAAPTDEALAREAQQGSRAAFDVLATRLRPRLVAALYRRVGSRDDAEDVAQQALLVAYRELHAFDPSRRFTTWLFTIAFRLAIDAKRAQRRRPAIALAADVAHRDDPWRAAAADELRGNLWATVSASLDETAYTILWLRFGEGLEPGEIAKVLGKTTVHVRVLQHRALKRLRKEVDPHA